MPTLLAYHDVDDVDAWLAATTREEFFGPLGITAKAFRDPEGSNKVGLVVETPDMETFENAMKSEGAAAAMQKDGVRPETLVVLVEG